MKKCVLILLALVMALAAFSGCDGAKAPVYNNDTLSDETIIITPEPTLGTYTGPEVSALPENEKPSFELAKKTLFWPEGAAESTADYMLTVEYPAFGAEAYNAAIDLYREELTDRVVNERMPLADRAEGEDVPATFVTAEVSFAGEYTNVIFNEVSRFGEISETYIDTVVMDATGAEVSFYKASGMYAPEDIAAQQIYNIIDRDPDKYHGDITTEDIKLALDLYNGYIVTETGYTLFVLPGVLAPDSEGVQSFSFTRAALYPLFVGDVISVAQYERMKPALDALAGALAEGYEGFESAPTALIATDFMTRMLKDSATRVDSTWAKVSKADYDAYFAACFSGAYPTDIALGDGTYFDADTAYIPNAKKADYGVTIDDARETGNGLMLVGVVMYGEPGGLNSGEVAAVEINITLDHASPIECKILSAEFR